MKLLKNPLLAVAAFLLVCCCLSGCQLFAIGGQKLRSYCPGLNIKIDGINWHENGSINTYILQYESSYHKKVAEYFADPIHGYTIAYGRSYYDQNIKEGMPEAIDTTTLGKIINKGKDTTASVYFDVTTDRIIIIEKTRK